jgi:hypothetical protein
MMMRARRLLAVSTLVAAGYALLGAAGAGAATTGLVCTNGPNFNLTTTTSTVDTPEGNTVFMWGYSVVGGPFQTPGPVLCVTQGQTVTITLDNTLGTATSMVFPGQENVQATGGSAGLLGREAATGGSVTYTFTASRPGTYLYESGTDPQVQVDMGLYGAIVVRPTMGANFAYNDARTKFDPTREYLQLLSEIDPALHQDMEVNGPAARTFDMLHFWPRYFEVNGREFPDTVEPNNSNLTPGKPFGSLIRIKPYDAVKNPDPALVRMLNVGELNHPYHPHENHLRLIAQDGGLLTTPSGGDAATDHFADDIASGQTRDFLFSWKDPDTFSAANPVPVTLPSYQNLTFKDGQTWYSGSPYLGTKGTLPSGTTSFNVCGEEYFPAHSHALNEFVNFDVPFGGMATLIRLDPLDGCTGFPAASKILAGTLASGTYSNLAADDAAYYNVNSTTVAPRQSSWQAGFSGVPAGATNLKLTYKGKNSVACTQTISLWNWAGLGSWVTVAGPTSVGTTDVTVAVPNIATPAVYIGTTGANAGKVQARVLCSGPGVNWSSNGNLMKIVYDAP